MEQKRYEPLPPNRRSVLDAEEVSVDGAEHGVDGQAKALNHCNADDGDQTDEQAVFSESRAGLVVGKKIDPFVHFRTPSKVCLRGAWNRSGRDPLPLKVPVFSDAGEVGVDSAEDCVDGQAETFDHRNADDRDQTDEQAVLGEGCALVVLRETGNEVTHKKQILFRVEAMTGFGKVCPAAT